MIFWNPNLRIPERRKQGRVTTGNAPESIVTQASECDFAQAPRHRCNMMEALHDIEHVRRSGSWIIFKIVIQGLVGEPLIFQQQGSELLSNFCECSGPLPLE